MLWSCDPMHGNTITSATGYKDPAVRPDFERGSSVYFEVHQAEGTYAEAFILK